MKINNQSFGKTPDGDKATLWTIKNSSGFSIDLCDWGATLISVKQPDRDGKIDDIVLGFKDASRYQSSEGYLGATCGRFANRIALGKFSLEGKNYELACNNGANHLHGGERGFNAFKWDAQPYSEGDRAGVVFSLISPDGDENYPGELKIQADYALDEQNRLSMDYRGETDKTTIINITNHAYWNLAGAASGSVLDQVVKFHSSRYLPVDESAIPTGEIRNVEGTAFDFRNEKQIKTDFADVPGGYDHCMVIDGKIGELRIAAEVLDKVSGRKLSLYTDRPGVQFYTGNFLQGTPYVKNGGLCLEPQDFPDAPNRPEFPTTLLYPGETYHHRSVFEFTIL